MRRPLLVGEDNPYSIDPRMALYPAPAGCAGHRLCTRVLGLTEGEYLGRFDRVNLCWSTWDAAEARRTARQILDLDVGVTVLLGAKVSRAFGYDYEPFTAFGTGDRKSWVILPHPSGRSRAWNEPGAYEKARLVLRSVGAL